MAPLLTEDTIVVGAAPADKAEAIRACGRLLVAAGHVSDDYIRSMFEREAIASTYLGNGVALIHGTRDALYLVRRPGISLLQIPAGVDFGGGNTAHLLIGLAARGDDHIDILSAIADLCADSRRLAALLSAPSAREMLRLLRIPR
jgi:PTS system mannitol-specific IIA component